MIFNNSEEQLKETKKMIIDRVFMGNVKIVIALKNDFLMGYEFSKYDDYITYDEKENYFESTLKKLLFYINISLNDSNFYGSVINTNRIFNNLTLQQIADQLKVSKQLVSNWENGKSLPNKEHQYQLSIFLKFDFEEFEYSNW